MTVAQAPAADSEGWELFTPDYDYVKEPYWTRTPEGEIVLCYPNGGMLHEMSGTGRWFRACEVEVKLAGWDEDEHHPMHRR